MPVTKGRPPLLRFQLRGLISLFSNERSEVLTPLAEAVAELQRRQPDGELRSKVDRFLENDIPEHFKKSPIFYLARHVASPNFETLRFLHLVDPFEIPAVIGQDVRDKFVSGNQLKRALGKMPISYGVRKKGDVFHERYEYVNILDFNTCDGRPFSEIKTLWGEGLVDFHTKLFTDLCNRHISIHDDSEWIDRNGRGSLLQHYKKFLGLFLIHGILFEDLKFNDAADQDFLRKVLIPAFRFVEKKFGVRPLIVQLTPTSVESQKFWLSYPGKVAEIVREKVRPSM